MTSQADLPETIAVFPLPGALLLPRARLPLHVFEPRYIAMFDDALRTPERLIGMVQPAGGERGAHNGQLCPIGCAGRITQFSETEDRRYMVTLTGVSRFRLGHEVEGFAPYRRFTVSWQDFDRDLGPCETDDGLDRDSFLALVERFLSARGMRADWSSLAEADDELLINSLAMLLDFAPTDRQALLEAPCLSTRRETLVALMEFSLLSGERGAPMKRQ